MKIEQLLVQHFYNAKKVTLQGIGTFTLSPDFVLPPDSDKDIVLPENAVSFEYNAKAIEDDALINYIVQQSRKMKPLASADLESYIMLATQFLHIGKPLKIDGIGMLEKSQAGGYQFIPSQFINTKVEDATVQLKEKEREDVSFANEAKPPVNNKKLLGIIAAVLVVASISWAVWYFLINKNNTPAVAENTTEQTSTIAATDTTKTDSTTLLQQKPDSIAQQVPATATGYTFKVVIKNYPSLLLAQQAYNRLTRYGRKLLLYTSDSATYKVAVPITTALSDTTRARDSIRILFACKPYIEIR
jgi:hypothetical protein